MNLFPHLRQTSTCEPSFERFPSIMRVLVCLLVQISRVVHPCGLRFGVQNDVAGKTGTTQLNVDGWFMAITPRLVIGTWVGADEPKLHFRSTSLGQGSATALPITAYFLQQVNKDNTLRDISRAKFAALPPALQEELDCKTSKSDLNIFQRIFKKKKKTKVKKFRGVKD